MPTLGSAWIDVASDAVKIGLGALIAGFFALLGSHFAHRQKLDEEYSRRRRDSLEKLSSEFDRVALVGMDRLGTLLAMNETNETETGRELADAIADAMKTDDSILECLYDLHSIEARLALLAFPQIAEAVETYREMFSQMGPSVTEQTLQTLDKELHGQRTKVITLMAIAYQDA